MAQAPLPPARRGLSPLAIVLLIVALAAALAWIALHTPPPPLPEAHSDSRPDRALTPGAVDPAVTDATICAHDWAPGDPPQRGGDETYARAARHTGASLKAAVFAAYHRTDPHDGGHSYEVDHLVPLSLGGRDVAANLWPESRRGDGLNAWTKDRLEYRLFRLVCHPPQGAARLPLKVAQAAFLDDWVAAYRRYCADSADCPAFGGD